MKIKILNKNHFLRTAAALLNVLNRCMCMYVRKVEQSAVDSKVPCSSSSMEGTSFPAFCRAGPPENLTEINARVQALACTMPMNEPKVKSSRRLPNNAEK